ncbi:Mediator of RNA polymerase II transcription subunit 6 [Rhizophlyctis rosea]|nr:Mediator of RNA polymerase II transcription subunit 6 [Rhizophlyctis rosea]
MADEDLLSVMFKDPEWLAMNPLTKENVLDYFARSQFYDSTSTNEYLKMQARFNALNDADLDKRKMTGVEFELSSCEHEPGAEHSLFVIRKQNRFSPEKTELIAVYYVMDGAIFQAPDLFTIVSNRVLTSLHHLQIAFTLSRAQSRFHPSQGYMWQIDEEFFRKQRAENRRKLESEQKSQSQEGAAAGAAAEGGVEVSTGSAEDLRRAEAAAKKIDELVDRFWAGDEEVEGWMAPKGSEEGVEEGVKSGRGVGATPVPGTPRRAEIRDDDARSKSEFMFGCLLRQEAMA